MDNLHLENLLKELAPGAEIVQGKQFPEVTVLPGELRKTAEILSDDKDISVDFLYCMTGIDHGTELGVVYHLRSSLHGHSVVLKTRTSDRENPVIDSVSGIWKTAEFHEDEIYDLLGIRFEGNPNLRRLFLEADSGFPLRKDYVDEVNIVTK